MTSTVSRQLAGLSTLMAELKERVRVAVAGELGRAVGDALRQVVQAAVAGRPEPPTGGRRVASRWDEDDEDDGDGWGRTRDAWDDALDPDDEPGSDRPGLEQRRHRTIARRPGRPGARVRPRPVAAGVFVARLWLLRRGTLLAAAGLGLGVGLLGAVGGPLARTAVAVLAATADVLTATDALGGGAARLGHF